MLHVYSQLLALPLPPGFLSLNLSCFGLFSLTNSPLSNQTLTLSVPQFPLYICTNPILRQVKNCSSRRLPVVQRSKGWLWVAQLRFTVIPSLNTRHDVPPLSRCDMSFSVRHRDSCTTWPHPSFPVSQNLSLFCDSPVLASVSIPYIVFFPTPFSFLFSSEIQDIC